MSNQIYQLINKNLVFVLLFVQRSLQFLNTSVFCFVLTFDFKAFLTILLTVDSVEKSQYKQNQGKYDEMMSNHGWFWFCSNLLSTKEKRNTCHLYSIVWLRIDYTQRRKQSDKTMRNLIERWKNLPGNIYLYIHKFL